MDVLYKSTKVVLNPISNMYCFGTVVAAERDKPYSFHGATNAEAALLTIFASAVWLLREFTHADTVRFPLVCREELLLQLI